MLNGSVGSTWDLTLPVDNSAGCNANTAGGTAETNKLFAFAHTDGAPDDGCTGGLCWNLYGGTITRNGVSAPFSLTAESVPFTSLQGTPVVAGSDAGTDLTLIGLRIRRIWYN